MFGRPSRQKMIAAAFEVVRANIMLADENLIIRYVNPSLHSFLAKSEDELRQVLPRFAMKTLIGSNIDIFHKNPSHQRNMLAALQKTHAATIWVGKHAFDLTVNPLTRRGKRAGFVVEWADANARLLNFDYAAQIAAIGRSQPIIAFTPEGIVLDANERFLASFGYTLEEIRGKHHSLFVEEAERKTPEYQKFWPGLAAGKFINDQFRRVGKGGREVWIQGSYNPIPDVNGKICKVIKFATDLTHQVNSVQNFGAALSRLARGDLQQRLTTALTPELDKLRNDLNDALATLQQSMGRMRDSANTITDASRHLQNSTDDLSARSEQQAATLEQSAAALNEITTTVKGTSAATANAQSIANNAQTAAREAADIMKATVAAMSNLETSSSQIAQIIGSIDEIAFQTNLLALNAGVEAARAGDAGRGFAVVASEVRALAQRSAEAAKEIKSLISASEKQVGNGVALVGQTGTALQKIIGNVNDMTAIVGQIAASAAEQALSLDQINTAVGDMNVVTQKNAAMAQDAKTVTSELAAQAEEMSGLVAQFRVDATNQSRAA